MCIAQSSALRGRRKPAGVLREEDKVRAGREGLVASERGQPLLELPDDAAHLCAVEERVDVEELDVVRDAACGEGRRRRTRRGRGRPGSVPTAACPAR